MIVRPHGGGLLLMTQPEHARLSGEIVAAWRADGVPHRDTREALVLAAREHDMGWQEADAAPGLDPASGRPYDFLHVPTALRQQTWPRNVVEVGRRSPLAGALVAEHALVLHARHEDEEAWSAFFGTLARLRDDLLGQAGLLTEAGRAAFERDYALVNLGDVLSLIFCNGWREPTLVRGYRAELRASELRVSPDPFAGATVPLVVRGRIVEDRPYASTEDLANVLSNAPAAALEGVARGV